MVNGNLVTFPACVPYNDIHSLGKTVRLFCEILLIARSKNIKEENDASQHLLVQSQQ